MNSKYLSIIILVLMLIVMIVGLIQTDYSTTKKNKQSRVYVDFSDMRSNKSATYSFKKHKKDKRGLYRTSIKSRSIKSKLFDNVMDATIHSYNSFGGKIVQKTQEIEKSQLQSYNEMLDFEKQLLPAYQSGLQQYQLGRYDEALEKFNEAINSINKMDITHHIDCYKMMAECYFKLKNRDGYIQNKIRQIRMTRKKIQILQSAFPSYADDYTAYDWPTTAEASKTLLKMRSASNRGDSSITQEQLRRADYDLEVSRKVTK